MANQACGFNPYEVSHPSMRFNVSGLPSNDACDPWAPNVWWEVQHPPGSNHHQRGGSVWCPALCAGLCSEPALHTEKFLFEPSVAMLSESVAIADTITSSPVYTPWSAVESSSASQVITDPCACWDWVVLRRRTAKDTSEHWYHVGTPRSETASRPGVRISDVVDEGRVEYVPDAAPNLVPPGPSKIRSYCSKQKRKISRSPVKLPHRFEVSSPPASPQRRSLVQDSCFASALAAPASRGYSRWSGRDRCATPVFQKGFP